MAISLEHLKKSSNPLDKAIVSELLNTCSNSLRVWREEHQKFMKRKLLENQKLLEKTEENQKNLKQIFENSKDELPVTATSDVASVENSIDSNITANSTVTGHILRCFDDSTESTSTLSKSEVKCDASHVEAKKPKLPFLRKRSGLLRYMPKSAHQSRVTKSYSPSKTQEPILVSESKEKQVQNENGFVDSCPKVQNNHVRFLKPETFNPEDTSNYESDLSLQPKDSSEQFRLDSKDSDYISNISPGEVFLKKNSESGETNITSDIQNKDDINQEIENKSLDQFELLETIVQNSSFNSDSSVLRDVFRDEPAHIPKYNRNISPIIENKNLKQNIKPKNNIGLFSSNCQNCPTTSDISQDILKKKQQIDEIIQDIGPRINTLQNKIPLVHNEIFLNDEEHTNERCSTPVQQNQLQMKFHSHSRSNSDSSTETITNSLIENGMSNVDELHKSKEIIDKKATSFGSLCSNCKGLLTHKGEEKSLLKEKIAELEKEIEIYQQENAHLAGIRKKTEEVSRKLEREYATVEKYKEEQMQILKAEMEKERRHLKQQKETFNRLQKLHKENPTQKEREEIKALRQENETLQKEVKRLNVRFKNENKRMRNQLITIEKERDFLKLELLTSEERCEDLLSHLKIKNSKKKSSVLTLTSSESGNKTSLPNNFNASKDKENIGSAGKLKKFSDKKALSVKEKTDMSLKPKVRFNLVPQFEKGKGEVVTQDELEASFIGELETASSSTVDYSEHIEELETVFSSTVDYSEPIEELKTASSSTIGYSEPTEVQIKDTSLECQSSSQSGEQISSQSKHAHKEEKVLPSGDREIMFPSGTKKFISADKKTIKTFFHNGDIKEIYPDKQEIYQYASGVIEKTFSDGLKVIEFPNGEVERHFPSGSKVIEFPDGTLHTVYDDGSEEIIAADGTKVTIRSDGTEIVEKDGEKEIRTATYIRREFLDGSVKIMYQSGKQETRYSNGRIRIKDEKGKVFLDTKCLKELKS